MHGAHASRRSPRPAKDNSAVVAKERMGRDGRTDVDFFAMKFFRDDVRSAAVCLSTREPRPPLKKRPCLTLPLPVPPVPSPSSDPVSR